MGKNYKGKFSALKNPSKYGGDISKIVYRSHWERNAFRWCDENPNIVEWSSEEVFVPYDNPTKGRAKYYPDLLIKMIDGTVRMIEIKPKKQVNRPEYSRKTKKAMTEEVTWQINCAKWDAAKKLCDKNGIVFEIWTEDTLKEMGILSWETDKSVLMNESTRSNKPKLKPIRKTANRPKRRS